jgi:hypothetical protein
MMLCTLISYPPSFVFKYFGDLELYGQFEKLGSCKDLKKLCTSISQPPFFIRIFQIRVNEKRQSRKIFVETQLKNRTKGAEHRNI